MSLNSLLEIAQHNYKKLLLCGLVSALLFSVVYALYPYKYQCTGSFFVGRSAKESETSEFFSYQGYYAQQTAQSYANTVAGIMESTDIKSKALEKMGLPISSSQLNRLSMLVKVRKPSPQLITLTTYEKTPSESKLLWNSLTNASIEASNNLNKNGDPLLYIVPISPEPIVKNTSKNPVLIGLCGLALGITAMYVIVAYKKLK